MDSTVRNMGGEETSFYVSLLLHHYVLNMGKINSVLLHFFFFLFARFSSSCLLFSTFFFMWKITKGKINKNKKFQWLFSNFLVNGHALAKKQGKIRSKQPKASKKVKFICKYWWLFIIKLMMLIHKLAAVLTCREKLLHSHTFFLHETSQSCLSFH